MNKNLPIGISDFKEVIEGGYAYVDKTFFIQEILEKGTKVDLIPRLRRFGKTKRRIDGNKKDINFCR